MSVTATPLDADGLRWAQRLVAEGHYLHKPVDVRCSPLAYRLVAGDLRCGCLIFGRPESTRTSGFYGSLDDISAGRAEVSRWCVLNLARVYLYPWFQGQVAADNRGAFQVPGFTDRRGVWRSTLASSAVNVALDRVVLDYLLAHPPCFPDEPYELAYCLSYCDTRVHRGALYRAAGFELVRTNERGIQTWRKRLRSLSSAERDRVLAACEQSARSRRYRSTRMVGAWEQAHLGLS